MASERGGKHGAGTVGSPWPIGDGHMAGLIRRHDWSATPLGPTDLWPADLRSIVQLLLGHQFPMMLLWGRDHIQIYNDDCRALMGAKHEGALGRPAREVWSEIWGLTQPILRRVWDGETVTITDHPVSVTRKGVVEEAWFTACYSPARTADGTVGGIFMTVNETTSRRRELEAQSAREAQYQGFFNAVDAGFCTIRMIFDARQRPVDYVFLEVNRAFETHSGLVDAVGRRMREMRPDHEEHWFEIYGRVALTGTPERFENRSDALDRWFSVFAFRIGPPERRELAVLFEDITERRQADIALERSRRRLATLVEGIPQLVWRATGAGMWTWSNPQWSEYTGLSLEASRGEGWIAALHPDDREDAKAAWARASRSERLSMESRIRASDGGYRWFQTRAMPMLDDEGRIIEWLGTSTDIDELRTLQDEQGILVAELQHRTRNLLGVVQSIAQQTLKSSGSLDDFGPRFGDRLRALSRVQGLLSRAESEPITIGALLRLELDALGADSTCERVVLTGPEVPLRRSSVQTLALALHELATNALKHGALATDTGRLSVVWQVTHTEGAGRRLSLEWVEEGAAMGSENRLRVETGYGRELIERALPYSLGATTRFELLPEGVRCSIALPLARNGLPERQR